MVSASKLKTAFTLGICAAFIAVMMGAAGAAFAGNYADKYYAVSSSGHGYTWTPSEHKDDYTSLWNDRRSASGTHNAQIIGAQSSYNGTVRFVSPKYAWWDGKAGYMSNYVKENGCNWATLWIDGSPYVWAKGYWSPDSI